LIATGAKAQSASSNDIELLRKQLEQQQKQIQIQGQEIRLQSRRLSEQLRLLDAQQSELQQLRSATTSTTAAHPQPQPPVAQVSPPARPLQTAPKVAAPAQSATSSPAGQAAPIQGPSRAQIAQKQSRQVLQTNASLARVGGVLTPKGTVSIEPSFEYDYTAQNQAVVNGFTIVPGITFGNINLNKITQNVYTAAVTIRAGITNKFELNLRIPYVYEFGTTTTSAAGVNAQPIVADAHGSDIGDIQLGASYQINNGENGWPIFVGNLNFKTITGRSPFDVPVFTINDPNGTFLQGVQKVLPTGTGFYSLEPSITVLYPTAPGILFANLKYIWNIPRTVDVQSTTGGPATPTRLAPGSGIGVTFGMGFSLNEDTSFSIGYEQDHYFEAAQNGKNIKGSSYDQGTFNFGLGYRISDTTSLNVGVGIGVGPNSPAAQIIVRVPIRFNAF